MRYILVITLSLVLSSFTGFALTFGQSIHGDNLSFVMTRSGEATIYLTDIRTRLTVPLVKNAYSPAWSPDGQHLAFASFRDGGSDIFRLDLHSLDMVNLTVDNDGWDGDPAWSPDGQHLAFVSDRASFSFVRPNFDIFVMDVDNEQVVNFSQQGGLEHSPVWSPDSQRLAYISNLDRRISLYISDMPDATHNSRPLDQYAVASYIAERQPPIWSVDGEEVLYSVVQDNIHYLHAVHIANDEIDWLATDAFSPTWSPDGEQLVYVLPQNGKGQLYLHEGEPLTDETDASLPVWSPDGTYLAYIDDDIYLMNAENKQFRRLTFLKGVKNSLAWRP